MYKGWGREKTREEEGGEVKEMGGGGQAGEGGGWGGNEEGEKGEGKK